MFIIIIKYTRSESKSITINLWWIVNNLCSNKLHEGRDWFVHFCSLLYPWRLWNTEGPNKHLLKNWMEYILASKVVTKNQNTYFNNAVIAQTILWKELFFENFFWDYFHFFYSHISIFGSNQYTLNVFTYVIYQAWIQITFSVYSQRVHLPSWGY